MVARNEGVLMAQRTTTNQEKGEKFPEKMLKKKEETVGLWIKKWSYKLWWRIVDDPPLRSQLPKRRIKPTLINIAADKVQKRTGLSMTTHSCIRRSLQWLKSMNRNSNCFPPCVFTRYIPQRLPNVSLTQKITWRESDQYCKCVHILKNSIHTIEKKKTIWG